MHSQTQKTKDIVLLGLLTAVLVIMAFTPLGYLQVGAFSITFNIIPVAIGAVALGVKGGAILGFVFGLTSFVRCFGLDALGTALMGLDFKADEGLFMPSAIGLFIQLVLTRVLVGVLTALIFKIISKFSKINALSFAVSGLVAAILNTVLYMTALLLIFGNAEPIKALWNEHAFGASPIVFAGIFVGVNAIFEAAASMFISPAILLALTKASLINLQTKKERDDK